MTPAARLKAAIDILDGLNATNFPADRFIRDWFRTRRYAGSKDRSAIAERVYDVLRRKACYAWRMRSDDSRALVLASVAAEAGDVDALFRGEGYGPEPLSDAERAALAQAPQGPPPFAARYDVPAFLEAELERSLGADLDAELAALKARAPVDLRVNTLKTTREALRRRLIDEGFAVEPTPYSSWGLRIAAQAGLARLRRSEAFAEGLFEFQDEAAQLAVFLADAKPGARVLDLAAGAGGKTLALAAAMDNEGDILAGDIDQGRLRQLEPRLARAGATVIRMQAGEPPPAQFDLVFLDAPCSGSGTWRRQPEQKWRLTPARLAELMALQDLLLEKAAARTAKGGRLVYATCSLLACENEDRIEAFLAAHPAFAVTPAAQAWRDGPPPPGLGRFFRASPAATGTDGFFAAILVHKEV